MTNTIELKEPVEDSKELINILFELAQCIGTQQYHKGQLTLKYTDGIKELIDLAKCYWLIQDISIVSSMDFNDLEFQIWILQSQDGRAVLTMKEDTNEPVKYRQEYPLTDFPEGTMKIYVVDNVMLLPSEY